MRAPGTMLHFDPNRPRARRIPTRIIKNLERLDSHRLETAEIAINLFLEVQERRAQLDRKGGAQ
jgi:hypothetical protein